MPKDIPGCESAITLPNDLSQERKDLFTQKKKEVLDALVPDKNENSFIPMSLQLFTGMLENFANSVKKYNGVRIYFASYPGAADAPDVPKGNAGKLTVLFVPTQEIQGQAVGGTDDPDNFHHLYGNQLNILPNPKDDPQVTTWINNYRNKKLDPLESHGRKAAGNAFNETLSLWYPMVSIAGGLGEIGIVRLIRCGQMYTSNRIIGLATIFAAFIRNETVQSFPYYQLTVTFNLKQENDPIEGEGTLNFGSGTLKHLVVPTDTGLPCPPNGNCPR